MPANRKGRATTLLAQLGVALRIFRSGGFDVSMFASQLSFGGSSSAAVRTPFREAPSKSPTDILSSNEIRPVLKSVAQIAQRIRAYVVTAAAKRSRETI